MASDLRKIKTLVILIVCATLVAALVPQPAPEASSSQRNFSQLGPIATGPLGANIAVHRSERCKQQCSIATPAETLIARSFSQRLPHAGGVVSFNHVPAGRGFTRLESGRSPPNFYLFT